MYSRTGNRYYSGGLFVWYQKNNHPHRDTFLPKQNTKRAISSAISRKLPSRLRSSIPCYRSHATGANSRRTEQVLPCDSTSNSESEAQTQTAAWRRRTPVHQFSLVSSCSSLGRNHLSLAGIRQIAPDFTEPLQTGLVGRYLLNAGFSCLLLLAGRNRVAVSASL